MTATESGTTENVILVDESDQEIGSAEKLSAHRNNQLHRAFSVFIFRKTEENLLELLLQQRALNKYHSPGLWTNTCCSHPRQGENTVKAGERRLKEELGLTATLKDLGWFHYNAHFANGLSENEIDHVLVGQVPSGIKIFPDPDEVHAYRWLNLPQVQQELLDCPNQFTPWLKRALDVVLAHIPEIERTSLIP